MNKKKTNLKTYVRIINWTNWNRENFDRKSQNEIEKPIEKTNMNNKVIKNNYYNNNNDNNSCNSTDHNKTQKRRKKH